MRRLFRWVLREVGYAVMILGFLFPTTYAMTFVIHHHGAYRWPIATASSSTPFLKIDIYHGRVHLAKVVPVDQTTATANRQAFLSPGGYSEWNVGIVPMEGNWQNLAITYDWRYSGNFLPWAIGFALAGGLVWGARKIHGRLTEVRVQTGYCLQCGHNIAGSESDRCPECGAPRPLVTLSSTSH